MSCHLALCKRQTCANMCNLLTQSQDDKTRNSNGVWDRANHERHLDRLIMIIWINLSQLSSCSFISRSFVPLDEINSENNSAHCETGEHFTAPYCPPLLFELDIFFSVETRKKTWDYLWNLIISLLHNIFCCFYCYSNCMVQEFKSN